jgi:hypothetical protein
MDLEVTPAPSEAERTAIEIALARVLEADPGTPGPWWQEGVRENLATDADELEP